MYRLVSKCKNYTHQIKTFNWYDKQKINIPDKDGNNEFDQKKKKKKDDNTC